MFRAPVWVLVLALLPSGAAAQQVFETVGSRALGMGGAFVGVADDATATYWNPAGLATGGPAGLTIEWAGFRTGDQEGPLAGGPAKRSAKFTSLGTWPLGLSYLKTTETYLVQSGALPPRVESLRTSQFDTTVLQTIAPGFVIGATLKYVRGTVVAADATGISASDALDHADMLQGHGTGTFDMDLSAMIDARVVRIGVTVKNLREPTFSDTAGTTMSLRREARAGLAVLPTSGLTLALDLDLETVDLRDGQRRMLAVGGEQRINKWLVARGGVRWNLLRDQGPAAAGGASVLLHPHLWLDMHVTGGDVLADHGFGVALRAGF
jgi:hypothetical protein